jgi:VanZ like family
MSKQKSLSAADLALPLACILVVSILFTAGLWPFNPFPRNQVAWRAGGGLQFGDHGVLFSRDSLEASRLNRDSFCTLAIRLQPGPSGGTLLEFYTPENPSRFRLMQWRDTLLIRKDYRDVKSHLKTNEVDLDHSMPTGEPVSFIITANPDGSVAYRNGVRAVGTTRLGLSCGDFAGQLVLGDSAVVDNAWRGKILDLIVYERELTPSEIASKYSGWNDTQAVRDAGGGRHVVAHYTFTEGSGQYVHGQPAGAPDLYIPEIFKVPHKKMLMWPWEESHDKRDFRDISTNILGFVPFGFVFMVYLKWNRKTGHATVVTILCGAAVSLTIEILQEYIPGRDSGLLDIFTNTLGTFLGALLFRWALMQNLTRKVLDSLRSAEGDAQS